MTIDGAEYYSCCIVLDGSVSFCLWYTGDDKDGVLVEDGRILVWPNNVSMESYISFRNLDMGSGKISVFDLDYVERLAHNHSLFNSKECLNLWNFLSDAGDSIGTLEFKIRSQAADELHARLSAHELADILRADKSLFLPSDIDCICSVLLVGRKMIRENRVAAKSP